LQGRDVDGDECETIEDSELGAVLRAGLQSSDLSIRSQSMRLIGVSSLKSYTAFKHLVGILDTGLYMEDQVLREFIHAAILDAVFIHHHRMPFDDVARYLLPFLFAPTTRLQLNAVVGLGRLLLASAFPEDTEIMLAKMLERYVSNQTAEGTE
jgi:hypothetical protein